MKKIEKLVYTIVIASITGLPLINFLRYCNNLADTGYYKYFRQSYLIYTLLPILFIVYIYGIVKKYYKITYVDVLMYILGILGIISTIFAVDVKTSIWGEVIRYEGLLALFYYYLLFLNVKNINNEKYKRNIIKVLIITAILQLVYSFLQVYTDSSMIMHFPYKHMAIGVIGNPNFYGSYMVMLTLITVVLYSIKGKSKYLCLTIMFFIGLCLASSTAPFLGFILAYVFFFLVFIKRIKMKKFLLLTIVLIGLFFVVDKSVVYVHNNLFSNVIYDTYNIKKEVVNSVKNVKSENFGNGRIKLWKNTLPVAKKYFWVGCGIDNFAKVYPQSNYLIFDKAHNIYLQMLVTNGIFALVTYCAVCLIIFIKGFKLRDAFSISLFIAFVGYSIQAFANISVIDVAPIFYIILGLLYTQKQKLDS